MRFSNLTGGFLAILLLVQSNVVLGNHHHPHHHELAKRKVLEKREEEARELALRSLPDYVQEELLMMDKRDYELDWESYAREYDETTNTLLPRQENYGGLGAKHCKDGRIAMTQDDGPYHYLRDIAQAYHQAGHNTTFFINVQNWDCAYDLEFVKQLRYAIRNGQEIASHTGTHADLTTLTIDQIDEQIELVEKFTWLTLGLIPANLRPPYGNTNKDINAHLRSKGYRIIQWALDLGDATGSSPDQSIQIIKTQLKKGSGKIVLSHETEEPTAHKIVPAAIQYFNQEGIKSVSISKCLQTRAYKVKKNELPPLKPNLNCVNQHVPLPGKS